MRGCFASSIAAIATLAACRQIVGIGDAPPGASDATRDASGEAPTGPSPECGTFAFAPDACENIVASGVSFALDPPQPQAKPYYFANAAIVQATSTPAMGGGGFVNVQPGIVTLEAFAGGQLVSEVPVIVHQLPSPLQ